MKFALILSKRCGYLSEEEVVTLDKYTVKVCERQNGNPVIINIGAGVGTSGITFREACQDAEIYTLDIQEEGHPLGSMAGESRHFKEFELRLPIQILGDSAITGKSWDKDKKVDLLFVDGDHDTSGVSADIEAWFPHLKVGGYVLFHDYRPNVGYVADVVDAMMEKQKFLGLHRMLAVFEKVGEL